MHLTSYPLHCLHYFIKRDQALNSGKRKITGKDRICRTDRISLDAGTFHQSSYRVADEPHDIFQSHCRRIQHNRHVCAAKFRQRTCRHCRRTSRLSLTSAGGAGDTCIFRNNTSDRSRRKQSPADFLIIKSFLFPANDQHCRKNAARACCGSRHDLPHRCVKLYYGHSGCDDFGHIRPHTALLRK